MTKSQTIAHLRSLVWPNNTSRTHSLEDLLTSAYDAGFKAGESKGFGDGYCSGYLTRAVDERNKKSPDADGGAK